ncbi:DUF1697 domain-containing protein [Paenibacillus antri]|uniref:DUF1697 domain-containing protein n=1 Tax=Paenibacillus antri TaxID=2582848 RepID=A0A5R9G940_9BACL|nr:DUF1697 domain-containing protein [Paenibacillus antri]TLS49263.1 DUF1697 domain-containing protein [Paenibacillus antri]
MTGYIALLRGINVGGNNVVKMAELREALEAGGLRKARTYIQSGNILCESDGTGETVGAIVGATLERMLGKTISVVVRSFDELERIMADCPYEPASPDEGKRIMLALLNEAIPPERAEAALRAGPGEAASNDEFTAAGREVYFRFETNVSESPLGNRMMKLGGAGVTTRNWNTMDKLLKMSRE